MITEFVAGELYTHARMIDVCFHVTKVEKDNEFYYLTVYWVLTRNKATLEPQDEIKVAISSIKEYNKLT